MNCDTVREQLLAYLDNRLAADEQAALRQHIATCPACQQEMAELWKTQNWFSRSLKATAARATAPPDAWARFEARLASSRSVRPHHEDRKQPPMDSMTRSSKTRMAVVTWMAAAAILLLIGLGGAVWLLSGNGTPSEIAGVDRETAIHTPEGPISTPSATLSPEEIYGTARPQSGGGSPGGDGPSGEGIAPTLLGTVSNVDAAARTLTLEPDGQVVRVMDFTEIRIEDVTWDGALASFEDIQTGMSVQVDLLDAEPSPPFARLVWIKRTQPPFWEDGAHELYAGEISAFDPATGVFAVAPLPDDTFQISTETRILLDSDAYDGDAAGVESVEVGQMVHLVSRLDSGTPRQVMLLMIVPPDPTADWQWLKGTVAAVEGNRLTVQIAGSDQTLGVETGPAGYAELQGMSFAAGETLYIRGFYEDGQLVAAEIIQLATGQWLRLRDERGPLWP